MDAARRWAALGSEENIEAVALMLYDLVKPDIAEWENATDKKRDYLRLVASNILAVLEGSADE
jgi:hypothetical protein